MDAQSVKNVDTAGLKGYDAGKKVSGIKRHIAVDTLGLPHAVVVTTAEVTDRQGALAAFKRCKRSLGRVQSVLADGGYTGAAFAQGARDIQMLLLPELSPRGSASTRAVMLRLAITSCTSALLGC